MTRQVWAAIVCLVILALSIGGWAYQGDLYDTHSPMYGFVRQTTPKADIDRAEAYGRLMRHQDLDGLRRASRPDIVTPQFYQEVPVIANYYPKTEPTEVAPTGYSRTFSSDGTNLSTVTIIHRYADGSVILTTTVTDVKTNKVYGFNLHKLSASDLNEIRFDPGAADGTQAGILTLAIAVFMFTLATAYACLATPVVPWKWAWFIFIMGGVGSFQFNWLTEVIHFEPLTIHWAASGYFQNLFEPATIFINLPVGAVVYWLTRKRKVTPAA